jgi:hypothetical protein
MKLNNKEEYLLEIVIRNLVAIARDQLHERDFAAISISRDDLFGELPCYPRLARYIFEKAREGIFNQTSQYSLVLKPQGEKSKDGYILATARFGSVTGVEH